MKPTKPGYYWLRRPGVVRMPIGAPWEIVRVYPPDPDAGKPYNSEMWIQHSMLPFVSESQWCEHWQWSGPLEPPMSTNHLHTDGHVFHSQP